MRSGIDWPPLFNSLSAYYMRNEGRALSTRGTNLYATCRKIMLLEANSVDSGDFRNYIWNALAFIDNIAHSVIC